MNRWIFLCLLILPIALCDLPSCIRARCSHCNVRFIAQMCPNTCAGCSFYGPIDSETGLLNRVQTFQTANTGGNSQANFGRAAHGRPISNIQQPSGVGNEQQSLQSLPQQVNAGLQSNVPSFNTPQQPQFAQFAQTAPRVANNFNQGIQPQTQQFANVPNTAQLQTQQQASQFVPQQPQPAQFFPQQQQPAQFFPQQPQQPQTNSFAGQQQPNYPASWQLPNQNLPQPAATPPSFPTAPQATPFNPFQPFLHQSFQAQNAFNPFTFPTPAPHLSLFTPPTMPPFPQHLQPFTPSPLFPPHPAAPQPQQQQFLGGAQRPQPATATIPPPPPPPATLQSGTASHQTANVAHTGTAGGQLAPQKPRQLYNTEVNNGIPPAPQQQIPQPQGTAPYVQPQQFVPNPAPTNIARPIPAVPSAPKLASSLVPAPNAASIDTSPAYVVKNSYAEKYGPTAVANVCPKQPNWEPCIPKDLANDRFRNCCQRLGEGCAQLCSYDQSLTTIQLAVLTGRCPIAKVADMMICASGYENATPCCEAHGVFEPGFEHCRPYCNPAAGLPNDGMLAEKYRCLGKLSQIQRCFYVTQRP